MYNNITSEDDFEMEEIECDCGDPDCLICNPPEDDCENEGDECEQCGGG